MSANFHATGGATEEELDGLPNFTAVGGDWNEISDEAAQMAEERIVVNLGPVHPSTHGVYRLLIELDGEYVREIRGATGFLHTGIEKNMEYRTWTQGVAYVTRMDYVASFFQEVGYCLAVERLLGIEGDVPRRASQIRVLLMELQRIASHLVAVGSALNELGATTMMTIAFRTREDILRIFERISGLRMNNEFVRPGGVLEDVPEGTTDYIRGLLPNIRRGTAEMEDIVAANPIFKARFQDVGVLSLSALMALGQTGPGLKAAGLAWDLRKSQPYCGYEDYEFDVPVRDKSDAYNRAMIRFEECYQSLRIVYQALDLLDASQGEPVMVARAPVDRHRRAGHRPGARARDHGRIHGGPHPPLQARHRGVPGPGRPGFRHGRARQGRVGVPHRLLGRDPPLPRPRVRPGLPQSPGPVDDGRRRPARRRHRLPGLHRPRHGRC